eukprot:CAMPEP_0170562288 /NCGR_PEP_ID=MMETSP0211-20121228/59769_1 /TAXON_ID=311385 /ORGANISM="Pseudokeronopsis sp., Strain OXSARD2" /LENGTH=70 /DNA_ID=CAMNT_0010878973 /DNA_START=281 /DNA_END=493 /DNA_ORIENTATION=-
MKEAVQLNPHYETSSVMVNVNPHLTNNLNSPSMSPMMLGLRNPNLQRINVQGMLGPSNNSIGGSLSPLTP